MPTNTKEYMRKTYKKYHGTIEALRARVKRVQARRIMEKKGLVRKGDGKEVHHKRGISGGNGADNLAVVTMKYNRRDGQRKATKSQLANKKSRLVSIIDK